MIRAVFLYGREELCESGSSFLFCISIFFEFTKLGDV